MPTVTEYEARLASRKGLIEQAGHLVKKANDENRDLTAEEEQQFDSLHDEADKIRAKIDEDKRREEIAVTRRARQEEADRSLKSSRGRLILPNNLEGAEASDLTFRGRRIRVTGDRARRSTSEYRTAYGHFLLTGTAPSIGATLQTDVAENGGYLSPPEYTAEIVRALDSTFWFRQLANVLPPTSASSLQMPRRTARMQTFTWGQELGQPTADTALKLGGYKLTPHYMTGELDVSHDLLMSAIVDVDAFVIDEIVYCSSYTEEDAFLNGDGNRKPVGLFIAHAQGLDTDRDSTAAIGHDGVVDCKMNLREPYLRSPSLRWVCGRPFMKACMKLKSTTNEPLWIVSLRDGQPDLLVGTPVVLSEFAPSAVTSGSYPAVIGDFKNYDIIDSIDMGIARDESLGRRSNMVVYIVRRKVDGCVRIPEAFSRFKVT